MSNTLQKLRLVITFLLLTGWGVCVQALPAVAFFYGANPPWNELQAFDSVVVDPDHVPQPTNLRKKLPHTHLVAYVALGEVQPSRAYASGIPKTWLLGENKDWGSRVIDQAQPAWSAFFVEKVIAPLWDKGYRSFFLDTLDSYHLVATTPEQRAAQEAGMIATIEALKKRFPQAKLIFNRGFEILPSVHRHVEMVVAESLFQGYDAGKQSYKEVSEEDRAWLLGQLQKAQKEYKLAVMSIDYVHPSKRELARETAKKIAALGIIPWVAEPSLASLGIGSIEVMPRKILVVHAKLENEFKLRWVEGLRVGGAPLNYLGYTLELVDIDHLPTGTLPGRYAGAIVWMSDAKAPPVEEQERLTRWLTAQVEDHLPIALVNPADFMMMQNGMDTVLGLTIDDASSATKLPIKIIQQSPLIGFEVNPRPGLAEFPAITPSVDSEHLITLQRGRFKQVAAAITSWGGYVLESFSVITLPGNNGDRWVIDPFAFFEKALRLPKMPVPDTTTESGRRMLMVHMDGDGFVSRAEIPGTPLAGDVLLNRFVKKYPIPMTISVIESEMSPQGLYPNLSQASEKIAQEIFRQPHVAIASHSYSHPFVWRKAQSGDDTSGYNLNIPGYQFDLEREVKGSVRYIESRLTPPGKKVEVFLWTGDCVPGGDALKMVEDAGMVNMNGGDTVATRSNKSVTAVEGLGVPRYNGLQIYAPNQNENVYTNNWTGPFYGFERVIETFEFTEVPRRLKPIDIYFHTYIATKMAGIKSLEKVFNYALSQEVTPVHITDYTYKVQDFQNIAVAKSADGWRVRGAQNLRTLRMPSAIGNIQVADSRAVAGYRTTKDKDYSYVHLSNDWAELMMGENESTNPYLVSANAKIEKSEVQKGRSVWTLKSYVPLKFDLRNAEKCQVRQTTLNSNSSYVTSQIEAICP